MAEFHDADWWKVELERLIEEQIPEDLHLDYKEKGALLQTARGSNRPDKQKRAEDISKDVSSFLNSDGGVLVYGVPETQDPNFTGGSLVPGGSDIGFLREDNRKETIENLVTSNIQPKPGSELFRVVEVPFGDDGRVVFVVEVGVGLGGVWQAKDKRYYRRFQFKAEPMDHYEIELVRNRSLAPDLRLVFGINDRWEREMSNSDYLARAGRELRVHVGVQNSSNAVAESALIEFGVWPLEDSDAMMKIVRGEFPDGVIPDPFLPVGIRNITWDAADSQLAHRGESVAWSRMFWNDSNPALAERYAHQVEQENICGQPHRSYSLQTGYDHTQVGSVAVSSNCGIRCCSLVNESVVAGFSEPQGGGQTDGRGEYQDNILIEQLPRTVKEEVYLMTYSKGLETRIGLREYLRFYNHPRPHQLLAYRTQAKVFYGEPVVES